MGIFVWLAVDDLHLVYWTGLIEKLKIDGNCRFHLSLHYYNEEVFRTFPIPEFYCQKLNKKLDEAISTQILYLVYTSLF